MNKLLNKTSLFALAIFIIALSIYFTSTRSTQEQTYPQLLVDADSAIMRGNYVLCDSLLKKYDKTTVITDEGTAKYRQLLRVTRKFNSEDITLKDLAVIDSLCSFYHNYGSTDKYVRALLFRSEIEELVGDYPTALKTCLDAKKQLKKASDTKSTPYGWTLNRIGDIYFMQKLYNDCKGYYRQFYNLSIQRNDTLRMAFGAYLMGIVYTIEGEADSICAYYEKCIALSEGIAAANMVRAFAIHGLCDIYIQTEQFDKALAIMPRDEQNYSNWAYWHYGQNHVDSAIYYFRERLGKVGPVCDAEYLRILTQLEQERGNTAQALADYQALLAAEDSAKAQSQAEATRQAAALHEYEAIVAERNDIANKNQQLMRLIGAIVFGMIVFFGVTGVYWWKRRAKKGKEHAQQDLPENEEAGQEHETATEDDAQQQTATEQQEQQAGTEQQELLTAELEASDVYRRLMNSAPGAKRQLSDDEWLWLSEQLDALHHDMGQQLQRQARLSPTELRLCYLTRLGLTSTEMADVLCKSVSAVSHARYRMSKKILGDKADIDDLNDLIMRY